MKHYLSYDAEGKLVGIHTHQHAGTKLGGWPDDCCLDDPNCQNPTSKWFRENIIGKNGIVGFVACDCGCSPTSTDCCCASTDFSTKKVVNGVLVSKLEGALLSGQSMIANGATIKRPPGSKLTLRVACVGATDGMTMDVYQRGVAAIIESSPLRLTFTNSETQTFEVTVPAQGMVGMIALASKDVLGIGLTVIGWM